MVKRGSFTVNISKVLDLHNMSEHDLAIRTYLPEWYIHKICKGSVNPSIFEVLLFSECLSTPVEQLYWLDD